MADPIALTMKQVDDDLLIQIHLRANHIILVQIEGDEQLEISQNKHITAPEFHGQVAYLKHSPMNIRLNRFDLPQTHVLNR